MSQDFRGTGSFIGEKPLIKSIWTTPVIVSTAILVVAGTINTISFKLHNQYGFKHGMVQCAFMFFGEYICILIFGGMMMIGSWREKNFAELSKAANKKDPP
jgi:drug/metabolite transporter (DMT)-like permease